jgi:PHD/YefM family antitoxin component YafN of YafNO toxin-antitoxin module
VKVMTTHDARANFASVLKGVIEGKEEVVILRDGGKAAVIIALDTWNGMLQVVGDRTQADQLMDAIESAENHGAEAEIK